MIRIFTLDLLHFKIMSTKLLKILPIFIFLLPALSQDEAPYSYSWQDRPRSEFEEMDSVFNFQSQRIRPIETKSKNSGYQDLEPVPKISAVAAAPTYVRHPDVQNLAPVHKTPAVAAEPNYIRYPDEQDLAPVHKTPAVAAEPNYIRYPDVQDYGYAPDYENRDVNYIPNSDLSKESSSLSEEIDISQERMGGFGGTGDIMGYGAFEYKSKDHDNNDIYEKRYTNFRRRSRNKDPPVDSHLNSHPLQSL